MGAKARRKKRELQKIQSHQEMAEQLGLLRELCDDLIDGLMDDTLSRQKVMLTGEHIQRLGQCIGRHRRFFPIVRDENGSYKDI